MVTHESAPRRKGKDIQRAATGNRDVLRPVNQKRHRRCFYNAPGLKRPERFTRRCVERVEVAFIGSREHKAPGGGENPTPWRRGQREVPFLLTGRRIQRTDCPGCFFAERSLGHAGVKGSRLVFHLSRLVISRTHLARRDVEEAGARTVRRTSPIRRPLQTWIN